MPRDTSSALFHAIADPTRRQFLHRLATEGEQDVTELMRPLQMSQPAVSKHLRCLRKAGLVSRRTRGRRGLYSIRAERLRPVFDWVSAFEHFWDTKLDALGDYLDKRKTAGRTPPAKENT